MMWYSARHHLSPLLVLVLLFPCLPLPHPTSPCHVLHAGPLLSAAVAEGGQRVEGVVRPDRCYGCGRCLPVCPLGLISASSFLVDTAAVLSELRPHIDALEIHTNSTTSLAAVGQGSSGRGVADPFVDLWDRIHADASSLSLVSVSFPYMGEQGTPAFLRHRAALLAGAGTRLRVWQTDGR